LSPSSNTGGHSFLYDKPERCWNDPPLVQERQPKVFYFKKWQTLHLLNCEGESRIKIKNPILTTVFRVV